MNNKGGDFIVKKTDYNTVFVPEEWNEEQKMLKQMIFDFLDQEIHSLENEHQAAKDLPEIITILEKAAPLGLCGVAIEEKFGGSDVLSFQPFPPIISIISISPQLGHPVEEKFSPNIHKAGQSPCPKGSLALISILP